MQLEERHITALSEAEFLMAHRDFCPYLELRELLAVENEIARTKFRALFTTYYGLNRGGLTDDFKQRFFQILFAGNFFVNGLPDFSSILNELSLIPRLQNDFALPFSFVSKLVAIHDESSPIYDKHVKNFFGVEAPPAKRLKSVRIQWFIDFMNQVADDYAEWAIDERVTPILAQFKARDPRLDNCNAVRLIDFLVWKVGNKKLL